MKISARAFGVGVLLLSLICACRTARVRSANVSKDRAIAIANKELSGRHYGWPGVRVVGATLTQDGTWAVLLECVPTLPDAHVLIEVSARDGEVLRYYDKKGK